MNQIKYVRAVALHVELGALDEFGDQLPRELCVHECIQFIC